MKIEAPAAKVTQGNLVLFATSLKVSDLIKEGFYCVDKLEPNDKTDSGYQRVLQENRAKKLANYIQEGQESRDAFLPTSVFLATEKNIVYDETTHKITFSTNELGSFSVVDGQHRLEGLRIAAEKDRRVLDFQIPVNIAHNMPFIHQMCHFLIVNTSQKSVDKAVEQDIYARLSQMKHTEDIPNLPKWIQKIVDKGEISKALHIAQYLNSEPESPWHGKIQMANELKSGKHTIKQGSFVNYLNKYLLLPSNPIYQINVLDTQKRILLNYWKAIANILDDGTNSVLFKTNGLSVFANFSAALFSKIHSTDTNYKVESIQDLLQHCFDSMEGEYDDLGYPEFWSVGGKASAINQAAIGKIVHQMVKALNYTGDTSQDIVL